MWPRRRRSALQLAGIRPVPLAGVRALALATMTMARAGAPNAAVNCPVRSERLQGGGSGTRLRPAGWHGPGSGVPAVLKP